MLLLKKDSIRISVAANILRFITITISLEYGFLKIIWLWIKWEMMIVKDVIGVCLM